MNDELLITTYTIIHNSSLIIHNYYEFATFLSTANA
jgi:hypothetical protein